MASLRLRNVFSVSKLCMTSRYSAVRCLSTSSQRQALDHKDRPLPFSSSKAKNWDTIHSFRPPERKAPWYEWYSVMISMTAFLLYFLVLREENDMDEYIGTPLYERIPGLEESQIKQSIEYNRQAGKDTAALWNRLAEIEAEKKK